MTETLICERVGVQIGGAAILHDVSHCFQPGRVTALLGANGAGKSTLLACLTQLRQPDTGRVLFGERALAQLDRRERGQRIGFLPQVSDVHWDVDARTLVMLGRFARQRGWGASDQDHAAVAAAMASTDVTRFADRVVNSLSGGERSRVLLARVLAGEPEWLLADEPLASLDPAHQLDVLDLLQTIARSGVGVIAVLHDLGHALRVADDVVLLREGRLVGAGPCTDVLTPASIAATFGVEVEIGETSAGVRFLVPVQRSAG